jgi:hypothetical protein
LFPFAQLRYPAPRPATYCRTRAAHWAVSELGRGPGP